MDYIQEINKKTFSQSDSIDEYKSKLKLRIDEKKIIKKIFVKKRGDILIVGCGAGRVLIPLSKMGFNVHGMDISSEMIEAARRHVKENDLDIKLYIGDAAKDIANLNRKFDYVFFPFHSIDYISPLEKRYKTIIDAYNTLNTGGALVINSHNRFFYRFFFRFALNFFKPYIREKVPYGLGYTITFYANPWLEARKFRFFSMNVKVYWRGIIEGDRSIIRMTIKKALPFLFSKSFYVAGIKE